MKLIEIMLKVIIVGCLIGVVILIGMLDREIRGKNNAEVQRDDGDDSLT